MIANPEKATFRTGLIAAVPIVLGYLPIAFSFGVAARNAGLSAGEAFGLSLIIYAGASQFLALALITSGSPVLLAALPLVAMNLRHVLYGPALMKAAGTGAPKRYAWAWAFGLTDEVFGAALGVMGRDRRFSEPLMFGLGIAAYAAWLSGTALGAYAGGGALNHWPVVGAALGFMLTALFLALLLSILKRAQLPVIVVAGVATMAATLLWSSTAGILAGMICGAVMGIFGTGLRQGTARDAA